jgi:primosomal protein N' (replication factor Y)
VPEISLTPQVTARLYNNFGGIVAVLHSKMSLGERYDAWRGVVSGKYKVVVGPRSAMFAPLKDIGIIIVDEEHDGSYKQFENVPRYHARDAAVMLGKFSNCPVILGSATPSSESMYNAKTDKYRLVELTKRIDNARMPKIALLNMAEERKRAKLEGVFSKTLLDRIKDRLEKKQGVIILQNRRGFATQVYCDDCQEFESCPNCSVGLVYHIQSGTLQCHYCGFSRKAPPACTNCGSVNLMYYGTGTQRVEDELAYYFPNARIERIDSDSIGRKGELSMILTRFGKGEIDILIGTQMVAKGLDFPNVTLVGVISAEATLWLPDFRADERTFQLLTQVAGRAGRSNIEGEVLIQTQNPDNFTLQMALANNYAGFYEKTIFERQRFSYPPFSRLCLIETKDEDEQKAAGAAMDIHKELMKIGGGLIISPPNPAVLSKLKGQYRFHIMVKSLRSLDTSGAALRNAVLNAFITFNRESRYRDVRAIIDIDPQSVI